MARPRAYTGRIRWLRLFLRLLPKDDGPRDAAPLLVKVGHADDAIANLEAVIRSYTAVQLDVPAGVRGLIEDIKNDKI